MVRVSDGIVDCLVANVLVFSLTKAPRCPRQPGQNSIKMHIIQPESQSGQIPADFPRCGWVRSVGDTVPPPV